MSKLGTKAQISAVYRGVASLKIKDIQGDYDSLIAYKETCEHLAKIPAQYLPVAASNALPKKIADVERIIHYVSALSVFNAHLADLEPASESEDESEEPIELSEPENEPPKKKRKASKARKVSSSPEPKAKKSKAKGKKKPVLRSHK